MNLTDFVALLVVDFDAIVALAGLMAVGIVATVQTLKVLQVATTVRQIALVAYGVAVAQLVVSLLGYFFPTYIPIGLFVWGSVIALAVAVNGYQYGSPIIERLFPGANLSMDSLSDDDS